MDIELKCSSRDQKIDKILRNYEVSSLIGTHIYGVRCSNENLVSSYYSYNNGWFIVASDLVICNLDFVELEWIVLHEVAHIVHNHHLFSLAHDGITKTVHEHCADSWAVHQQMNKRNNHYGISALHKLPGLFNKSIHDRCHVTIDEKGCPYPLTYVKRIKHLENLNRA